jgi:alpha-L-fucosidase
MVTPTPQQLDWQDKEIGMFFHFDIPVFTDLGEGAWPKAGHLDPNLYDPAKLDTDQWLEAAKALGATYTVFVAKHCSGFLSWQSDLYPYGVKQSRWRGGKGDVVKDYMASCRRYGIKPGLYASVSANAHWEVNNPGLINWGQGGDAEAQAKYVQMSEQMLAELWGNYGPLYEIWFDGGALDPSQGGPNLLPLLLKLQPTAVVFGGPAASIRWIGNEKGVAPYPCWATVPADARDYNGAGDPDGKKWMPGECDVPIRNHDWFWHPNAEHKLYPLEQLLEMYYQSVGRNCNLLINANINREGLVPEADFERYRQFGAEIRRRFGKSLAETTAAGGEAQISLPKPQRIDHVILMEDIAHGERVREYLVEGLVGGAWQKLCDGISIGHKRIQQFAPIEVAAVRLRVTKSVAEPYLRRFAVFNVEA